MTNTLKKFGYPNSLVRAYDHWYVLLRPEQVTLGSLVLMARGRETRFGDLPDAAFVEYSGVIRAIERVLSATFRYDKINYLMLMMVDPEVHCHVLPRFAGEREFEGVLFQDAGWPGFPDLKHPPAVSPEAFAALVEHLRSAFAVP